VHWRYALSETKNYKRAYPNPLTGCSNWGDEYWTVYPDGVAVRKQVPWSSRLGGVRPGDPAAMLSAAARSRRVALISMFDGVGARCRHSAVASDVRGRAGADGFSPCGAVSRSDATGDSIVQLQFSR